MEEEGVSPETQIRTENRRMSRIKVAEEEGEEGEMGSEGGNVGSEEVVEEGVILVQARNNHLEAQKEEEEVEEVEEVVVVEAFLEAQPNKAGSGSASSGV